ncbi:MULTISPECIES: DUF6925 family protein [unclassified Methylobacterium]|jgi:hypothetical protein|uniref:DUF6925 family protein n=1 Tax=unclassified Methylobacterium TaxID=2615210 RepID=UPI0013532C63|nr:hypothetical protein [Methylobacterium sp. 2A]MWV26143.1 hypothetical protein [Methylobacterium sp. 2A]
MTGQTERSVEALLRAQVADPNCAWSLGSYGAVAAFRRDPDEPARPQDDGRIGLATDRGALALLALPALRPVAYETGFTGSWSQAVALCLPVAACAMGRRAVLTELGPDAAAARPQDRDGILFDLGLGLDAVDACVRVAAPDLIGRLRAACGRPLFEPGNPVVAALTASSPHRVFIARIGRIEVYTAIPAPGSIAEPGPHSHILPKLLRLRRTHAATAPIPQGWVPVAALHPAHPGKDAAGRAIPFDAARHAAFGRLLAAWGDPVLAALRRAVLSDEEPDPVLADGRYARSAIRAARVQRAAMKW